jgi:hypothetical protein
MADRAGTLTIRQLVDGLITRQRGNRENNAFYRWALLAMDAYRHLRLFSLNEPVYVKLTPDALNRVSLPTDYIGFVNIYVPVGGKLVSLTRDDQIVPTLSGLTGAETLDSTDGEGVSIADEPYAGYMTVGGYNVDGYYTLDEERRKIILVDLSRTEVVLAYISTGVSSTDTFIPMEAVPAMEAHMIWNDKLYQGKLNEAKFWEDVFDRRADELAALKSPTLDEWLDAIYSQVTPLARR